MRNTISGEIKEVSQESFLALFDKEVHAKIVKNSRQTGVEAVVCLENLQMDSSQCGHRAALIVGPSCTFQVKHLEDGFRLGEVPSRFQYPVAIWRIKE
jgi:hypothetical protein